MTTHTHKKRDNCHNCHRQTDRQTDRQSQRATDIECRWSNRRHPTQLVRVAACGARSPIAKPRLEQGRHLTASKPEGLRISAEGYLPSGVSHFQHDTDAIKQPSYRVCPQSTYCSCWAEFHENSLCMQIVKTIIRFEAGMTLIN